ncbi:hypothetical protein DF157_09990 [Burkholderia cenocepacia]|nr:hypothetical protein A8E96_01655 [Burkholderia cenocepacia]ONW37790.1 hypothetical protein A8E95_04955 [Burkholderia cenocepacia]RQU18891.1 hypothetical protein DF157_09990 [Burkholderia cenocepacia]RQV44923.1 hypothetical protein DF028_06170 [Burkholderia cenocepacia]RQV51475.1 hypothetical protein DF027_04025 [Burkholderia cenocepacia]
MLVSPLTATRDATPASHRLAARIVRRRRYGHAGNVPAGVVRPVSVRGPRGTMWHRTARSSRCKVFNGM